MCEGAVPLLEGTNFTVQAYQTYRSLFSDVTALISEFSPRLLWRASCKVLLMGRVRLCMELGYHAFAGVRRPVVFVFLLPIFRVDRFAVAVWAIDFIHHVRK